MTPQEIIEKEKLILEFMGYKLMPCRNGLAWEAPEGDPFKMNGFLHSSIVSNMKFHYSWDQLMPVVKKCSESFEHHQYDSEEYYHITEEIFHPDYSLSEFMDADIEAVYSRVVTYIKWYNQNKASEETKSCPNCKETKQPCACMRNICHKCGKPVGNITFTVCDECWDIEFLPKK